MIRPPSSTTSLGPSQVPGLPEPPFELVCSSPPALPVLIAVPHAGRRYPQALLDAMREPEWSMLRLEDRLVDLLRTRTGKLQDVLEQPASVGVMHGDGRRPGSRGGSAGGALRGVRGGAWTR